MTKLYGQLTGAVRPAGCASSILLVTAVYVSLGAVAFAAWGATGNIQWVLRFFRVPGAVLMVGLAGLEFWLARRVRDCFPADNSLHSAWKWISISALWQFIAMVLTQILRPRSVMNPLMLFPNGQAASTLLFQVGQVLGGVPRYGCLAIGFWIALRARRRVGVRGRLAQNDWMLVLPAVLYVAWECLVVFNDLQGGKSPSLLEVLGWPVDPLLVVLLAEALLLRRATRSVGPGWASRCWGAYVVGLSLVILGDAALSMRWHGYLASTSSSFFWLIWLPASCAFAMAPAYKAETIFQETTGRDRHSPAETG